MFCGYEFVHFYLVPKDTTTNKTISFRRKQLSGLLLTTLIFLWIPSKLLISLAQSLKLSLRKSSTHRAKASWGLLRTWWRTVTKVFGRAWKRWKNRTNDIIHKIFSRNKDNKEEKLPLLPWKAALLLIEGK